VESPVNALIVLAFIAAVSTASTLSVPALPAAGDRSAVAAIEAEQ
jgi:hypothetical protein